MAQLFKRSANTLAKIGLVSVIAMPAAALYVGSTLTRSPANTKVGVPLEQPAPFSHEHHITELGIDCRYCHSSVEKGAVAGIPPTETCMSCHSQVWTNSPLLEPVRQSYKTGVPLVWNKVNAVPDYVYFNHSVHINRGLNCNICHGPVQSMMLTYKGNDFQMRWCLECHREPEKFVRERETVFELYKKYQEKKSLDPDENRLIYDQYYKPHPSKLERGKQLLKEYGVNKEQLTDCAICHR